MYVVPIIINPLLKFGFVILGYIHKSDLTMKPATYYLLYSV